MWRYLVLAAVEKKWGWWLGLLYHIFVTSFSLHFFHLVWRNQWLVRWCIQDRKLVEFSKRSSIFFASLFKGNRKLHSYKMWVLPMLLSQDIADWPAWYGEWPHRFWSLRWCWLLTLETGQWQRTPTMGLLTYKSLVSGVSETVSQPQTEIMFAVRIVPKDGGQEGGKWTMLW